MYYWAGPVLTRTLTRPGWPLDSCANLFFVRAAELFFLTRAIAYQLFGTNFSRSSWRRQKQALLILSKYKQYLHITEIWVHQVHILRSDRLHICTHFSIMLFTATSYFMIRHVLKMIYLKYMHIKKMGTDLYPVFCVVWVLNILAQVENVLAQVDNYLWRLIPRLHCTSITHGADGGGGRRHDGALPPEEATMGDGTPDVEYGEGGKGDKVSDGLPPGDWYKSLQERGRPRP